MVGDKTKKAGITKRIAGLLGLGKDAESDLPEAKPKKESDLSVEDIQKLIAERNALKQSCQVLEVEVNELNKETADIQKRLESARKSLITEYDQALKKAAEPARIDLIKKFLEKHKGIAPQLKVEIFTAIKRCEQLAAKWGDFDGEAHSWNRESSALRTELRQKNRELTQQKQEYAFLGDVKDLRKFIYDTLNMVRSNPRVLKLYAKEAEAAEILARSQMDPTKSQEDTMLAKVLLATFGNFKSAEADFWSHVIKATAESGNAFKKYSLLLDQLRIFVPDAVGELEGRIAKSDELKRRENKGEHVEWESYDNIISDVIQKTVTDRAVLQGIYTVLVSEFPEDIGELKGAFESTNTVIEGDKKIAEYITNKVLGQKGRIAALAAALDSKKQFIDKCLCTLQDLTRVAAGEQDIQAFSQDEACLDYVKETVSQLRDRLEGAVAYALPQGNPLALVKQAYVHQILGDAYKQEEKEEKAKEQYDKAKTLCQGAKEMASGDAVLEAEIKKFEKFAGAENG